MNGMFDWFTGGSSDEEVGLRLLEAYYDEAKNFPSFAQFANFDQWMNHVHSKVADLQTLLGELVNSNYASTSVDSAVSRVRDLAYKSEGTATLSKLVQAAGGSGDTINWSAMITEVGGDAISDLTDAAQSVGEGVLGTFSAMKYLPWILAAGGALFIYSYAQGGGIAKITKKLTGG